MMPCPTHDDRNPSLSVQEGEDGRVLIHCHAGCDTRDVVAAVGMEMSDLFIPAEPERVAVRPVPRMVVDRVVRSEYPYADEQGEVLFRVVIERTPDGKKKVFQNRAMPGGNWAKNLGAARRVLYRLPKVLRAVEVAAPVFVVEGEKCVEAVESIGLVATTNPGGAGKWLPEYSSTLTGADVIVLPDNDGPGLAHAQTVVEALTGVAAEVTVLTLPGLAEHGDVADWVAAGGTRETLLTLVRENRNTGTPAGYDARHVGAPADTDLVFPAPVLDEDALHGVFGNAIELLDGVTEAEPAAVLLHLLIAFGAMAGPSPYVAVGTGKQTAKTFGVVVGDSAKARKGTAWTDAKTILSAVDQVFFEQHYVSGLSSGEGLIHRVRDVEETNQAGLPLDPRDPRLLVVEPEWGKVLRLNQRQGNTLSAIVREAWDHGPLEVLTRTDPMRAGYHHIGLVGHVTVEELLAELDSTTAANGFANRHLFIYVKRNRLLPRPKSIDAGALSRTAALLRGAVADAQQRGEVERTDAAWKRWEVIYRETEESMPLAGIAGHLSSRAPAQILRLALIYALADGAPQIDVHHLDAGYAVWRYSEASVRHVFGQRLGNSTAERLLKAARAAGPSGLDGRATYAALDRNVAKEDVEMAVALLTRLGLIESRLIPPGPRGGRPRRVLIAT